MPKPGTRHLTDLIAAAIREHDATCWPGSSPRERCTWGLALHATERPDGSRVWQLTTLGGETLDVTGELLAALRVGVDPE